jgi:hypothetical protein
MATVTRLHTKGTPRVSKAAIFGKFTQWAALKKDTTDLTTRMNKMRDEISTYVEANGYQDDNGSFLLDLPDPVEVGGKTYTAIKRQRKVSTFFKEDDATALLERKGLLEQAQSTTVYLDQDKVHVLNQQGLLTDAEIDSMFGTSESYAFTPVTA